MIPDISEENYQNKMVGIRGKYGQNISIFIVYRTYSYALYDGEFKA
jgi:hypothetical protein